VRALSTHRYQKIFKEKNNKEFLYFDLDVEKYETTEKIGGDVWQ
jgi:hypothetical protein